MLILIKKARENWVKWEDQNEREIPIKEENEFARLFDCITALLTTNAANLFIKIINPYFLIKVI